MNIYQPGGPLHYEQWEAERRRIAAKEARRAAGLPLIPGPLKLTLVGLFGAVALAMVCAVIWGG